MESIEESVEEIVRAEAAEAPTSTVQNYRLYRDVLNCSNK